MKENPEVVEKVSRAGGKATDFAINDPDAAYEVMKGWYLNNTQMKKSDAYFLIRS